MKNKLKIILIATLFFTTALLAAPIALANGWFHHNQYYTYANSFSESAVCMLEGTVQRGVPKYGRVGTLQYCKPSKLIYGNFHDFSGEILPFEIRKNGNIVLLDDGWGVPEKVSFTGVTYLQYGGTALTDISSGWAPVGGAVLQPKYVVENNICHLSGSLVWVGPTTSNPIMTLPPECRPANTVYTNISLKFSGAKRRATIRSNGELSIGGWANSPTTRIHLAGIHFTLLEDGDVQTTSDWENKGEPYTDFVYTTTERFCKLDGIIRKKNGLIQVGDYIGRLPEDCRPHKRIKAAPSVGTGNAGALSLLIWPWGDMEVESVHDVHFKDISFSPIIFRNQ